MDSNSDQKSPAARPMCDETPETSHPSFSVNPVEQEILTNESEAMDEKDLEFVSPAPAILSATSPTKSSSNHDPHSPVASPSKSIKSAMSSTKSQCSDSSSVSPIRSPAQSVRSGTGGAQSSVSGAHSPAPPASVHGSVQSEFDENKDYETFGGFDDPYDIFKPKLIQLCHDIGLGEPDKVERMEGGSYNKIISFAFKSPKEQSYILRLPFFVYNDSQPHEIGDQVSVLLYLSQFDFMKVPQICAYDTTTNNAIRSQYVLQTKLPGSRMADIFYKLSRPEKLQLTNLIADVAIKMSKIKLPKPGRLVGTRSLPAYSHVPPEPLATIAVHGYRVYPVQDPPAMEQQHLTRILLNVFDTLKEKETVGHSMYEMYEKLQKITREMERAGLMRVHDVENVLWHWDFCARNILLHQELVTNTKQLDSTKLSGPHALTTTEVIPPKGCQHSIQFAVEEGSGNGHNHTVQVKIEDVLGTPCRHTVSVIVEDNSGIKYHHQLNITNEKPSNHSHLFVSGASSGRGLSDQQPMIPQQEETLQPLKQWTISGILDWDDVLAVPLVIARQPHSWLWFDEEERENDWSGNEDDPPHRDLTEDELLIKAQFDQILARDSPDYMEDAYGRGVWLRALSRFARDGFTDSQDWKRYEKFIVRWDDHYKSLGLKVEERVDDREAGQEAEMEDENNEKMYDEDN